VTRVRPALALLLGASLLALAAPAAAQAPETLALRAVRYYRTENQGSTRVKVLIQVPYMFMEPAAGQLSYQVSVTVADQQGLTLHSDAWRNHAPAGARMSGAFGLDMIDFAVASGKYRVEVAVLDSVSGKTLQGTVPVDGFAQSPDASDMLLASSMRVAEAGDTVPRLGEIRRGNTLFTAAAHLRLTPLRTNAFYLLEAYNPGAEASGTMRVSVLDQGGKPMVQTPAAPVKIAEGGGLLKGSLDLEGLPPGDYELRVAVDAPTGKFERAASFVMAPLEETLARDTMRLAAERATDEGWFRQMQGPALDSAFAPLGYVAEGNELRPWNKTLSDDGKRKFLADFWTRRDPSPGTMVNEARERFYAGIDYANRNYRERKVPGWKTDRGRIYIKNGPPDEVLTRVQEAKAPPYEAWRYTKGRQRWFIFADQTNGFGAFRLMVSNDLNEVRRPDWREILTEEAVRDAGRFLGVDFYSGQAAQQF
jgi:GWxTD domain-containing protein